MPTEPQPNAPSAPPLNWSAAILAAGRAGRPRPGPLASPIVMVLLLFCIAASLHADDTNAISPIVSYQYFDSLDEPGASNTVMSAVVSYQYEDALNAPGAETTIISPIVSYQYYDWPGDENVILQSSPKVSYFYGVALPGANVAVQGRVVNALGQPVAGATVCASILDVPQVTTQSAPDGSYQLPPLAPGVFVLCASQTGLVSDKRVVTLSASLPAQDFRLASFSVLPAMQTANSTAPFILTDKDELHGAKLMVFDGTQFVDNLSLIDSSKMTVVLTHGWILCLRSGGIHNWPSNMARALRAKGLTSAQANIVGWSWETDATDCFVPDHLTPRHGLALGKKLYEVLGTGYSQPLDFQGHSLGALVNRYAVNYLHGQANAKQEKAAPAWGTDQVFRESGSVGRIVPTNPISLIASPRRRPS